MSGDAGQDSGQPPGFAWADLLEGLVAAHGTLTAVAWRLIERVDGDGPGAELDVASVERALRRLRTRGQRDGGVWGQRLVRVFGVPRAIEARVRWMGLYQSPFNDLPLALCLDQLRLWDRPPVSGSRARLWLHLGYASCALRARGFADAAAHLAQASAALAGLGPEHDDARIELALASSYLASRAGAAGREGPRAGEAGGPPSRAGAAGREGPHAGEAGGPPSRADDDDDVDRHLDRAEALLAGARLAPDDAACLAARLVDQRAYQENQRGEHARALARYRALPAVDVHPFASYRRDAGLAFGLLRAGAIDDALAMARRACAHAGDGGYVRLRAMGLILVARIAGGAEAERALARAGGIAERLEDDELRVRVARARDRGKLDPR